ncbi:hypothetical protein Q7P37_008078 [Cladosporium fusiforme]
MVSSSDERGRKSLAYKLVLFAGLGRRTKISVIAPVQPQNASSVLAASFHHELASPCWDAHTCMPHQNHSFNPIMPPRTHLLYISHASKVPRRSTRACTCADINVPRGRRQNHQPDDDGDLVRGSGVQHVYSSSSMICDTCRLLPNGRSGPHAHDQWMLSRFPTEHATRPRHLLVSWVLDLGTLQMSLPNLISGSLLLGSVRAYVPFQPYSRAAGRSKARGAFTQLQIHCLSKSMSVEHSRAFNVIPLMSVEYS